MTYTSSFSATFTIADARKVASKVKTDLKLMQLEYGAPGDAHIENLGEEAAQLLNLSYLDNVTYGFRRDGKWIVALRYTARRDGTLVADERAGKVPRGVVLGGASFYSYLVHNSAWHQLSLAAQQAIEADLPIQRTGAPEPGVAGGYWTGGQTYSSSGSGTTRETFQPW